MNHRTELLELLYEHRDDMVCYDHPEDYCCTCGEHQVGGYREHLADKLEEVDRNARAYGWTIGRGHPLVERVHWIDPANPFLHADWRSRIVAPEVESSAEKGLRR